MTEKKKAINPQKNPMSVQDPALRVKNFNEVALGYNEAAVIAEAGRCLQCKNMPCRQGCPVDIDISAFIKLAGEGDFAGAAKKIKEKNAHR
jgi:glutamate synthase (NADPH/NADH) small chain